MFTAGVIARVLPLRGSTVRNGKLIPLKLESVNVGVVTNRFIGGFSSRGISMSADIEGEILG